MLLDREQFNACVSILVPHMSTVNERQALVESALFGCTVLHQIDWSGLHTLAKQAAKHTKLVLYIDQFEELFTLTTRGFLHTPSKNPTAIVKPIIPHYLSLDPEQP